MFYTTLNRIREHGPCEPGWKKLLHYLDKTGADDEPLSMLTILEANGIQDAIWALLAIDDCPEIRLFTVRCARQVQHLMADPRSIDALDIAEQYAVGNASDDELDAARAAAEAAAEAAAGDAARAAAWDAAGAAAWAAARAAARDAAWDAVWGAAWDAARAAAWVAARDAAWDAARAAQHDDFISIFCS